MSVRTPYSRVQGLGAARSGTQHFWLQRASAVALIPLSIWFAYAAIQLVGLSYEEAFSFLHEPFNALALALFVLAAAYHMTLGLQVVIEDYVHTEGTKLALLLVNKAFGWIIAAASVFAILRIAL
ncbi:MAG TPA: succinate dehydrogenase, hydrophobic membrane anchor protein [Rhizomicrobium sp.]|nr:succinate dehydrogenase, hydrophobic membrane anchor protein [Rhizomicrobium sp.]